LLHEVLREFQSSAQHKNIRLQFRAETPERYVACDPFQIRQALDNLVSNAIKYTQNGGQVELIIEQSSVEVLIKVMDNGLGIPETDLPHIFDRFYRVSKESHRDIEGTGLGLAIVKTIVEQHQGKIWVESALGHGTTFSFTLPLADTA
jgi:signal transduction histidine kinase